MIFPPILLSESTERKQFLVSFPPSIMQGKAASQVTISVFTLIIFCFIHFKLFHIRILTGLSTVNIVDVKLL